MVNHEERLDRIFGALNHATRRAMLKRLATGDGASVSELAAPAALSLPAAMKHLDVLERAALVTREKTGRTVRVRLAPRPIAEAMKWLAFYERFWSDRLDRLAEVAEAAERRAKKAPR